MSNILPTNLGIKDDCATLKPTINMGTAAKTLNVQQDLKIAELEELIFDDYERKLGAGTLIQSSHSQLHLLRA